MNYSIAVAYLLAAGTHIVPITTADNISNARHLRASKLNHEAHMMSLPIIAANLNIANDDDDDNINNSEQMKGRQGTHTSTDYDNDDNDNNININDEMKKDTDASESEASQTSKDDETAIEGMFNYWFANNDLSNSNFDNIDIDFNLNINIGEPDDVTTKTPTTFRTKDPTKFPTTAPSKDPTKFPTTAPTTECQGCLSKLINQVSVRVGTVAALDDPNSPQSRAEAWILEECDGTIPIDPCDESQLILIEQRYALAVMYFSLGGDGWNTGSNPSLDKSAAEGVWLSGLNYCDWSTEISTFGLPYDQLVCDEFGNVLNLNLRTYFSCV